MQAITTIGLDIAKSVFQVHSMHCDDDLTFASLFMFVSVKTAAALGQPFPKCRAFHCFAPIYL